MCICNKAFLIKLLISIDNVDFSAQEKHGFVEKFSSFFNNVYIYYLSLANRTHSEITLLRIQIVMFRFKLEFELE